jgi:hypothetical protein
MIMDIPSEHISLMDENEGKKTEECIKQARLKG